MSRPLTVLCCAVVMALPVPTGGFANAAEPADTEVAPNCPAPLDRARRLVLVTAPTMATRTATLRTFLRDAPGSPWRAATSAEPAAIGQAGMGWGHTFRGFQRAGEPVKREGDRRAPAGLFSIGASFGFVASPRRGHVVLKAGETVCVDDPASPAYNTISSRQRIGQKTGAEDMGRIDLYRHGLFVNYPSDRASRAGSCIFIHVWRGPDHGTAGCVALPPSSVAALQDFAEPGAVLAILPDTALDRFAGCLPAPATDRGQQGL